jgi:hypothetical protein
MCLLGYKDEELADFFEVNRDTIYEWKKVHPEFSEALKNSKELADGNVAHRLYNRAMGYETEEVDVRVINGEIVQTVIKKQIPPDPTSMIFWLKNRQRGKWRDKVDTEHTGTVGVEEIKRTIVDPKT